MAQSKRSWTYAALFVLLMGGLVWMVFTSSPEFYVMPDTPPSPPPIDTAASAPPLPPTNEKRTDFTSVDEAIAGMEWGNIVFNVPERLRLGDPHTIQLLLSPSQTVEQLRKHILQNDAVQSSTIRVSSIMSANLEGTSFSIHPITPEVQAVSSTEATEWRWEVRGRMPGPKQPLYLTLYAIFEINGRETPRSIQTFEEAIEIDVTFSQQVSMFVGNNWKWLWTVILAPLAGWIWERGKRTRVQQ